MATDAEVIRDLTRAKVAFQLRAIEVALTGPAPIKPLASGEAPRFEVYPPFEPKPHCRWCRELVIRGLPCTCERAQEEARRVRADHR